MKSLGYSNKIIIWYYVLRTLLIGLVSSICAIPVGLFIGKLITSMYNKVLHIPTMEIKVYWGTIIYGVLFSVIFCVISAYVSVIKVAKTKPCEAMRIESSLNVKPIFYQRYIVFGEKLSLVYKMSIRNLFRNKQRTIFTVLCIMVTIMLFMVSQLLSR